MITKDLNLVAVEILSVNDQVATIVVAIVVVLVISRMVSIFERDDRFLAGIPPVDEVLIGFRGSGGLPMKEKLDITSTSGGILKVTWRNAADRKGTKDTFSIVLGLAVINIKITVGDDSGGIGP